MQAFLRLLSFSLADHECVILYNVAQKYRMYVKYAITLEQPLTDAVQTSLGQKISTNEILSSTKM
jgi:hypothetical protein